MNKTTRPRRLASSARPLKWTVADQRRASSQGWGLINVDTNPTIQLLDDAEVFSWDDEVIAFLRMNAESCGTAAKALALAGEPRLSPAELRANSRNARSAMRALRAHGVNSAEDFYSDVSDLLVSLMMLCAKKGVSFESASKNASGHFSTEMTPGGREVK